MSKTGNTKSRKRKNIALATIVLVTIMIIILAIKAYAANSVLGVNTASNEDTLTRLVAGLAKAQYADRLVTTSGVTTQLQNFIHSSLATVTEDDSQDVIIVTYTDSGRRYYINKNTGYTIEFNDNGGSGGPGMIRKGHGERITLPGADEAPTRTGYEFLGWSTSDNADSAQYTAGGTYVGNGNVTLYAVWEVISYKITYDANGGINAPTMQSKPHDQAITLSMRAPTRTGHEFMGWNTDSAAETATYQKGDTFTTNANTTLYAIWEPEEYEIIYDANGGTGAPAKQKYTYADTGTINLSTTEPTKSGHYAFAGWSESSTATIPSYLAGQEWDRSIAKDTYLYAVWTIQTYTVFYDANGGTGTMTEQVANLGTTISLSANGFTPPTDFAFKEWNTKADGSGTAYAPGATFSSTSNIILYAMWKPNKYTVTYNANGGTGTTASQTANIGENITLRTSGFTPPEGHKFKEWNSSPNGNGNAYTPNNTFSAESDVILYAIWTKITYEITYNANGGTGAPESQTKIWGETLTLTTDEPTRTGYDFKGWSTSSSATTPEYLPGGSYTANSAATLYAVWKIKTYTISFNANGGSGAPGNQTKTYNVPLTLSSTVPTRPNYKFLGWSTSSTATTETYKAGGTYTANAAAILYAVWTDRVCTATADTRSQVNWGSDLCPTCTTGTRVDYVEHFVNHDSCGAPSEYFGAYYYCYGCGNVWQDTTGEYDQDGWVGYTHDY